MGNQWGSHVCQVLSTTRHGTWARAFLNLNVTFARPSHQWVHTLLTRAFLDSRGTGQRALHQVSDLHFWVLSVWCLNSNYFSLGWSLTGQKSGLHWASRSPIPRALLCTLRPFPNARCFSALPSSVTVHTFVNLDTMSFSCTFKKTVRRWKDEMEDRNKWQNGKNKNLLADWKEPWKWGWGWGVWEDTYTSEWLQWPYVSSDGWFISSLYLHVLRWSYITVTNILKLFFFF